MLRKTTRTLILILAALVIALGAHYAPLLYTESHGKPLPYLWAMVRLEMTRADLLPVAPDSNVLMQKCCPLPLHSPLTAFLATRGWTFRDQMGAGIIYEKANMRLTVISRMFSRRYVVYELHQAP